VKIVGNGKRKVPMDKVSVLDVIDRDSEQNAQVIVRSTNGFVALTITLEYEGDVQVVISPSECAELVLRLQQAISELQGEALISGASSAGVAPTPNPEMMHLIELDRGEKIKNG
jgi:hypothetical protein